MKMLPLSRLLGTALVLAFLFGVIAYARSATTRLKITFQAPSLRAKITKQSHCPCSGPETCTCAPGQCQCPACAAAYGAAYRTSLTTGKPLVLYVNCPVPGTQNDYLTCRVNKCNGRLGPCIVITCDTYICGELPQTATVAEIRAVIARCHQTTAAPAVMYYPQPMFFGGSFGGGFGGCAGGG